MQKVGRKYKYKEEEEHLFTAWLASGAPYLYQNTFVAILCQKKRLLPRKVFKSKNNI